MKTCVHTIVIRWQCVRSWTALLDQLTPTYMYLPLHTSSPEYVFNKIAWVRSYGGMIIVFIWRHHFMTSLFLLFYSLFSELNFNWQSKRTLWKKVFFLKGNSANPCLVHCLTSMECGWSCVMNNIFFKTLYSYLCHGQFLRICFFCKQKKLVVA